MEEGLVITTNGDHLLTLYGKSDVTHTASSTVMIMENSANATLLFGFADSEENFVPYPNGTFSDGKIINHGIGCRLMVRASNITVNTVTIRRFPI